MNKTPNSAQVRRTAGFRFCFMSQALGPPRLTCNVKWSPPMKRDFEQFQMQAYEEAKRLFPNDAVKVLVQQ